jgi:hypothetical protein
VAQGIRITDIRGENTVTIARRLVYKWRKQRRSK